MAVKLILALVLLLAFLQPSPVQAERVLTLEQVQWLSRWFPGREYAMARTAFCESTFRDDVTGKMDERGRLQIMPMHAWRLGFTPLDLYDPEINGYVGSIILKERPDGSAWTGYKGCPSWEQ